MIEQTEFGTTDFAENPEPRCPCMLLLDTSRSMAGQPTALLNTGLTAYRDAPEEFPVDEADAATSNRLSGSEHAAPQVGARCVIGANRLADTVSPLRIKGAFGYHNSSVLA